MALHRSFDPPFSSCRTQPAKTLLQSETGRIFQQRQVGTRFYDPYFFTPVAYGCLFAVDKRVMLGENGAGVDGHGEDLDHFRLAGPYAGFSSRRCPIDFCSWRVRAVDLRDGALLRSQPSGGPGATASGPVTDLVVADTGSVAWITSVPNSAATVEVWASDAAGARPLDRATTIDPDSLTLDGSTLTWRNGSMLRSATLD